MTDGGVVGCRDKMALFMRVPGETIAVRLEQDVDLNTLQRYVL